MHHTDSRKTSVGFGLNKIIGGNDMNSKEKLDGLKQELDKKIKENPSKIKDLKALVSKLEDEVSDYKIREVFTNKLLADMKKGMDNEREENKALEDEINDLEKRIDHLENQAFVAAQTIQQLKSENMDLMAQLVQEREQKEAYKEDSKKTLEANRELRKILKQNDRKLIAFRNALKESLL